METTRTITEHYERASLIETLTAALAKAGLGEKQLSTRDLAALDQFHSRGLDATVELASELGLEAASKVVDIGSGLGGPSRYLAATFGCNVHGVDLSQSFVDAATFLAKRSGLQDKVTYAQGDALALPYASNEFDVAWTQHVAMNIADRAGLYGEAFRVLRPGGRFAIFDVVAGSGEPLHFPVPWASAPEASFLVLANEMRTVLTAQGFQISSWTDSTEAGIAWFTERERERAAGGPPPAIGLQAVMGRDFGAATVNLRRNLSEGRAALIQAICVKP